MRFIITAAVGLVVGALIGWVLRGRRSNKRMEKWTALRNVERELDRMYLHVGCKSMDTNNPHDLGQTLLGMNTQDENTRHATRCSSSVSRSSARLLGAGSDHGVVSAGSERAPAGGGGVALPPPTGLAAVDQGAACSACGALLLVGPSGVWASITPTRHHGRRRR